MSIRPTRRHLLAVVITAALCASVTGSLVVPNSAGAAPTPTAASVEKTLAGLVKKNALLVEQYDQAQIKLAAATKSLSAANLAAQQAQLNFDDAKNTVSITALAMYESGSFSTAGALLSSDDGQSYLQDIQTLSMISTHFSQVAEHLDADRIAAARTAKAAADAKSAATKTSAALAKQRTALDAQILRYRVLLATLTQNQRATFFQTVSPTPPAAVAARVLAAVDIGTAPKQALDAVMFAEHQIGKPYVYGAAGPGSFDCSGLTMAAYASVGISLPHSSEEQWNEGKPVSLQSLRPGDLIFYYGPPPGHVEIYVGAGMAVTAPEAGENVKLQNIFGWETPIGARRIVG